LTPWWRDTNTYWNLTQLKSQSCDALALTPCAASLLLLLLPLLLCTRNAFVYLCSAAGLVPLVEWNTRREIDTKVAELQDGLEKLMSADPPHSANDIIAFVKSRKAEQVCAWQLQVSF
jgi:hypothetical protein